MVIPIISSSIESFEFLPMVRQISPSISSNEFLAFLYEFFPPLDMLPSEKRILS